MLVLTRKLQERICIGNDITVTILRVKGQQVRIGIEAPRDVRVIRGELPLHSTHREQPPADTAQQEVEPVMFEVKGTLLSSEIDSETADAEETSTVIMGRGRPAAMKQFVQSVLEGALAK